MNNILENLNEKQKEAVLVTEGPVMAIAGAGSGKTSVLTKRIAHLIYEKEVNYKNILAITFTNKAANEMKQRVKELSFEFDNLYIDTREMWISTFHAMCAKILRDHIELLGYKPNFQIIDDDDTLQLIKSIMKKNDYDIKIYDPRKVRKWVLKAKYERDVIDSLEDPLRSVVDVVFPRYEKNLKNNNLVDFEGLLILTIKLLKEHEEVKKYFNALFKYVLVDEFQDTNNIQYELIKLLVNEDKNLFIVGDEDQSIYAFRGANIMNISKFKKDFSGYHLVLLEENYRSTNNILNAANQIIVNNKTRIPKNLFSSKGDGEKITYYKGVTSRDEAEYVALKINELKRKGYMYNDFAVLYRANSTSRLFEDVLLQKHIPYKVYGNTSFFKRKEIKDFTSYLRIILNHNDDYSFVRTVNEPRRGIGAKTIENLSSFAVDYNLSLFEAIDHASEVLGKSACVKLLDYKHMIEDFKVKLNEISFNDLVDYILENAGILKALEKDEKGDVRKENLLEYKTILNENNEAFSNINKEEILGYILEEVTLKMEEKSNEVEDAVKLMTLHAAKGLEFPVVFIVTLEKGMFPLNRSFESQKDFEEERRLMYVGVTRAKTKLFLTNAKQRQTYGEVMNNDDSPFLKEINEELLEVKGYYEYVNNSPYSRQKPINKTLIKKKKRNLDNYTENNLNKGDKVAHDKFGEGVVITIVDDTVMIAFKAPHGIKKLLKNHASIKKI